MVIEEEVVEPMVVQPDKVAQSRRKTAKPKKATRNGLTTLKAS